MVAEPLPAGISLRRSLLRWLLPSVLVMLLLSMVSDYEVAVAPTQEVYDQALLDAALVVRDRIERDREGQLSVYWSQGAEALLSSNQSDRAFFSVYDRDRRCLAGSCWMQPLWKRWHPEQAVYRDLRHDGQAVRMLSFHSHVHGQDVAIQVGETTNKRSAMARRILIGMLIPELLTVLSVIFVVLIGVRRGLEPLERVRHLVKARPGADTDRLPEQQMPSELAGLVHTHNLQADRLQDSLRLQETFIANAAHQLRTPLAGLRTQIELAQRLAAREPVSAALRDALDKSHVGASRSVRLVQQMLGLARSQSSAAAFHAIDLREVVAHGVEQVVARPEARDIDIGVELAGTVMVRGIAALLEELLANLLDNALKYCPSGSHVTVSCHDGEDGPELVVEDDGPGIPEADRERVFERFYRRDLRTEGVGLGLAIVREIAELHLATIALDSSDGGRGLRVRVRFPHAAEASAGDA